MGLIHVSNWHGDTHGRSLGMLGAAAPSDPLGAGNTQLISDLGITPLGFWDVRQNLTQAGGVVSSWADVSGAGTYGPALTPASAHPPSWDGTFINFVAASSQNLQNASLTGIPTPTGVSLVLVLQTATAVTNGCFAELAAPSQSIRLKNTSNATRYSVTFQDSSGSLSTAAVNGVFGAGAPTRIVFAKTAGSGGIGTCEAPTAAATTVTSAGTWSASTSLNLARTSGASLLIDMALRAVLVLPGAYTNAQRDTLKTWAATYHSAVLL